MNILFCGHFLEQSGWGVAGRGYLKALNRTGHNIIARPIKPNELTPNAELDEELISLTKKPLQNIDICIQHVLPHFLAYNGGCKNIAIFVAESVRWGPATGWNRRLNMMDEIWFPNQFMRDFANEEGITKPVRVVPHTFNTEKYKQQYNKLDIPNGEGTYKFYFIGELIRRKRLGAILQAFHITFKKNENVQLVIKTNKSGCSPDIVRQEIEKLCNEVKTAIKLYPRINDYLREIMIVDYLTENNLLSLHESCDCFINASCGESWCIPAFEAMAMGNRIISTPMGVDEYTRYYSCGYKLRGVWQPCIGTTDTLPNLNSARELWYYADILDISEAMRFAYNKGKNKHKNEGLSVADTFSYENVAQKMKGLLECYNT